MVHRIREDGTCAVCGTADAHRVFVAGYMARLAARELSPWAAAMKAKIDAARKAMES
jgi:hypothetical protein